jgi:hypothetical protein
MQAATQAELTWLFKSLGVPIAPNYGANFLDNANLFGASSWVSFSATPC